MQRIVRGLQLAVIAGVLASGLFVVEQIASTHLPTDPYAPPNHPYVAVGQWHTTVAHNLSTVERQFITDLGAFWRFGAE